MTARKYLTSLLSLPEEKKIKHGCLLRNIIESTNMLLRDLERNTRRHSSCNFLVNFEYKERLFLNMCSLFHLALNLLSKAADCQLKAFVQKGCISLFSAKTSEKRSQFVRFCMLNLTKY